ncbi:hypothetical protein B0H14DRAFT_2996527 [Mycena olivaceomarginata]|nr:hypothetical protein B0H14DRAFT_2996527 [Mycena olivaceomarginata]
METTKQGGQKLRLNSIRGFPNPLNIDWFISLVSISNCSSSCSSAGDTFPLAFPPTPPFTGFFALTINSCKNAPVARTSGAGPSTPPPPPPSSCPPLGFVVPCATGTVRRRLGKRPIRSKPSSEGPGHVRPRLTPTLGAPPHPTSRVHRPWCSIPSWPYPRTIALSAPQCTRKTTPAPSTTLRPHRTHRRSIRTRTTPPREYRGAVF